VDIAYLIGASDNRVLDKPQRMLFPVLARVETGAWRPMPATQFHHLLPLRRIDGPAHPLYPSAEHFALEVGTDDSMNACTPYPILPGMTVLCIDMLSANVGIDSGRLYAVRTVNHTGDLYETVIRRIIVDGDGTGYHLVAESTNNHISRFVEGKPTTNPSADVCVFGLVYRFEMDVA
jgi:hypothetical protein